MLLSVLLSCSRPDDAAPHRPATTGPETVPATGDTAAIPPTPPVFEAPFLWAPIVLDGAPDLGHVPADVADPVEPGPLAFTEVAQESGLGAVRAGGNVHGVGVAFVDADGDGWDDVLVVNGASPAYAFPSALFRNLGDGTFEDATASSGLEGILAGRDGYSVAAGDVDRDGDVDLYVGAHPNDVLLLADGGTFTDGTAALGAGGPPSGPDPLVARAKIVGLGDYDADGRLDVVSASDTFGDGVPNGYVLHGADGAFEDATAATGFAAPAEGTPCAVMWTDHDADSFADLAIWSDLGDPSANRVLLRSDGATFTDVAAAAGWTNPMGMPMGIDAADVDRDGWLDYFVGNGGRNLLLLSNGDGTWLDWAQAAGITAQNSWGLGLEDLDADGFWDVFVGQPAQTEHVAFRHLRTDPPTFSETEIDHGYLFPGNVPVAFADADRDGDPDVLVGGTGGAPIALYRNDTDRGTARTLEVRVDAAPDDGARGAVGARVVVATGDVVLWRDVTGGSSRASQNALSARFGLGHRTGADWVAVLWPDGRQVVARGVPGNATLVFDGATAALR